MLRSCYTVDMFFPDAPKRVVRVRYFFVDDETRSVPLTVYNSRNWLGPDSVHVLAGEVKSSPRQWVDGSKPTGEPGPFFGTPDQWEGTFTKDDPVIEAETWDCGGALPEERNYGSEGGDALNGFVFNAFIPQQQFKGAVVFQVVAVLAENTAFPRPSVWTGPPILEMGLAKPAVSAGGVGPGLPLPPIRWVYADTGVLLDPVTMAWQVGVDFDDLTDESVVWRVTRPGFPDPGLFVLNDVKFRAVIVRDQPPGSMAAAVFQTGNGNTIKSPVVPGGIDCTKLIASIAQKGGGTPDPGTWGNGFVRWKFLFGNDAGFLDSATRKVTIPPFKSTVLKTGGPIGPWVCFLTAYT
jgi:hypothetical protein